MPAVSVLQDDALVFLGSEPSEKYDLIYVDPPFNTGHDQVSARDPSVRYPDSVGIDEFVAWSSSWIAESHRVLKPTGTMYVHLDWRSVFDVKPIMDRAFGRQNFLNRIIWSFNFGGRGKDRFPRKSNDILLYTKSPGKHVFNWDEIDRVPYKTPELQYLGRTKEEAEKRIALGQVPTDVWEIPILGTNSRERTGYPTQKPVALVKRAIVASSPPGGLVLDFFAGSGTTGAAALETGRSCVMVDKNEQAVEIMEKRFGARREEPKSTSDVQPT